MTSEEIRRKICFSLPEKEGNKQVQDTIAGERAYQLIKNLFPICRSITGNGIRQTLKIIKEAIPMNIYEVPTGTKVFDWEVPKEWNIKDAYVLDETGRKIIDFKENNLHILGYSAPIDKDVMLAELQQHLYSIEYYPEAIPYVTSYYEERWGFCLSHKQRQELKEGRYHVFIDSELKKGSLTYGELIIPGQEKQEVLLSTYICHPSMANNELSGPAVVTELVKWLQEKPRRLTYRIVFIPETIGSITYLSKNLDALKKNVIAGFNVTCVGDNQAYSLVPSRYGDTLADKIALKILRDEYPGFKQYSFLERGSDERQYCSPGVDLPVVCVMRSKFGTYAGYHTSMDNLDLISTEGLQGGFEVLQKCLEALEYNTKYKVVCYGEPQLSKRGLYPTVSDYFSYEAVHHMRNFIAYADGKNDLIDISNIIKVPVKDLYPMVETLLEKQVISVVCS